MRKQKTKKGKSTKTKISNSNKNHINITIHNSEKKQRRATRKKKATDGSYTPATQNPKGFTNTVTARAPPDKNYKDDPKLLAQIENYNNGHLAIANEANNPLIQQVHMLEEGNNALHQEFQDFRTGIQNQGNALLHEMNNLKHRTPLKILDKGKVGRPRKVAAADPEPKVKKPVGRPKKVQRETIFDEEYYADDPILSTPEGATEENQLNLMAIPNDSRKPKDRQPQKVVLKQTDSPSKAQQSINDVLNRGKNFLNTERADGLLTPVLKEQAMNDLYAELMDNQKKLDFKADIQDAGKRIRKQKQPHTP